MSRAHQSKSFSSARSIVRSCGVGTVADLEPPRIHASEHFLNGFRMGVMTFLLLSLFGVE